MKSELCTINRSNNLIGIKLRAKVRGLSEKNA